MNLLTNADPQIQQRGTSFADLAGGFTADRWYFTHQGVPQNSITLGRGGAAPGASSTIKIRRTAGSLEVGQMSLFQSLPTLESIATQGGNVVFTAWAKVGENWSPAALNLLIIGSTGTDQFSSSMGNWVGQVTLALSPATPNASMQPYSVSAAIPASITQLAVLLHWTPQGKAGADDSITFGGFDLRPYCMPPALVQTETNSQAYMKCAEFYEELARLDGGEPVCICEMGLTPQQPDGMTWAQSYISFQPKRFWKRLTIDLSPNMATDYHLTPLNGQPIYGLTVQVPSNHRSPTRQFIQAGWNGPIPAGYTYGMVMNFAVDQKPIAATPKFAINADL